MVNAELWNLWDGKHESEDQKKRLASAKKANMTPISINTDEGIGEFSGSTNYATTLSECTCIDFKRRQLPCKHMYRLAIELGLINEQVSSDKSAIRAPKKSRAKLEPVIEIVESLTDTQRKFFRKILGKILFVAHGPVVTEVTPDCDELIAHGFLVKSEKYEAFFENRPRYDLIKRLESNGVSGFKKNTKTSVLVEWIKQNVPDPKVLFDDLYVVNINSKFEGIQKKVLTYLVRRDDTELFYDPETETIKDIPAGIIHNVSVGIDGTSTFEECYPDDEITALLNKYGKNRCLK